MDLKEPPILGVPQFLLVGVHRQHFVVKLFLHFVLSEEGVWLIRIGWEILF
jgi:hypothetical protein